MIYLASQSPRRKQLLAQLGCDFKTINISVDESALKNETAKQLVCRLAKLKAATALKKLQRQGLHNFLIIAADTVVTIDNKILNKPATPTAAIAMLKQLNNRQHLVLTAVVVANEKQQKLALNSNKVRFANNSTRQIEAYVTTYQPFDKAGGYGIQDYAATMIKHISGSYSGIMGLPIYQTHQLIEQFACSFASGDNSDKTRNPN